MTLASLHKYKTVWFVIFVIIVVLDFVVPYTVLRDVASFYGAYTFWAILTAITIILGYLYMRGWRE